jgi:16S rRNA (cytosine1402-N4)-methyltransferase
MTEPEKPKSAYKRRPRYRGTHPRQFGEKYKELAPEKYPELVAELRERGRTPAGQHVPVLVEGTLAALAPAGKQA